VIDYGSRDVLGVAIDAVDLEAAVERISFFAEQRRSYRVSALAVHGIIEAGRDPRLRAALNDFDLVLPDGQAVRWAVNALYGLDLPDKVPGPSTVDVLLGRAAGHFPVFFYGSTQATLSRLTWNLRRSHPGLVVHTQASAFRGVDEEELDTIVDTINASGAQLCLIGLGCPRQERLVAAIGSRIEMPTLAVGAAFDYLAGTIHRAPVLIQRMGLEWAYRTMQDPRRLARRYLSTNTSFAVAVAGQFLGQRLLRRGSALPVGYPVVERMELIDA
jgi:exopolysaccharide biosynthesis WecB/TagA/CpsF family protein